MPTRHLALAAAAALACPLPAQAPSTSVLDLDASYYFGSYAAEIDVPSGAVLLAMERGSVDFVAAGTFSGSLDFLEWTAGGGALVSETFAGAYRVSPEGQLLLDYDPSNPGTDVDSFYVDAEADVFHHARYEAEPYANSIVAVRKSSGQSNASLSGTYRFQAEYLELTGAALASRSEWGAAVFDGAGSVTVSGTELSVSPSGVGTTGPVTGTVPYSVAGDGELLVDGRPGAISPDGEFLFFTIGDLTSSEVGLVGAVRQGAAYNHADLAGRYSLTAQAHYLGPLPLPTCQTDFGEFFLTPTGATTGTWTESGVFVDSNRNGVFPGLLNSPGGATALASNGVLTMTDPNSNFEIAFSASGRYAVGRSVEPNTNTMLLVRQCALSGGYGGATPGTGGVDPALGMKGFPTLGNAAWAWQISRGRGGAPAILAISLGPAPGLPALGGLIHVDPTQLAALPLALLGGAPGQAGAGAASVPLPIPMDPSLADLAFFSQALVLDPAAPADFAMSPGFLSTICPF